MTNATPTILDVPDAHPRLLLPNLRLVLEAWYERNEGATFPWRPPRPEEVEIGFSYALEPERCVCSCMRANHRRTRLRSGKVRRTECQRCDACPRYQELQFCGRIDLLPQAHEGRTHTPVDHKTTYDLTALWVRQWLTSSQITGYVWAAGQYCGEPVSTAYVNAIALREVPTSDRECKEHAVPYNECGKLHVRFEIIGPISRSDAQVRRWVEDVQRMAAAYRRALLAYHPSRHYGLPQEGTFHDACSRCELQEWCENEQPSDLESLGYVRRPWSPITHAMPGTKPHGPVFHMDNSTLRAAAMCTSQAVVRYGWDYTRREQTAPLRAGIAIHAALEAFFRGATLQQATEALERAFTNYDEKEGA